MVSTDQLDSLIHQIRLVVFDFDGVFTDNAGYVSQDGSEMVRCWRSDGLGLRLLPGLGVEAMVLSTEENPVVSARCRKLKLVCVQGVADKAARLAEILVDRGVSAEFVAYVGNDINDEGALKLAGLPVVVSDAHPSVVGLAKWQTETRGGYGAVREICDRFFAVRRGNI